jgi:hypothetical protein
MIRVEDLYTIAGPKIGIQVAFTNLMLIKILPAPDSCIFVPTDYQVTAVFCVQSEKF